MQTEDLKKELYADWERNILNNYLHLAEHPYFDKLYSIKSKLYDYFFPLGISGNSTTDLCRVLSEIDYAVKDDGDLSIVLAYTDMSERDNKLQDHLHKKYGLNRKVRDVSIWSTDIFVMFGYHSDVTLASMAKYALEHSSTRVFKGYQIKPFDYGTLDQLCSEKQNYDKLIQLSKCENVGEYYQLSKDVEQSLIEKIFEQRQPIIV